MKIDKHIFHIINKYLSRKESAGERAELYQWYDDLSLAEHTTKQSDKFKGRGKERLMVAIGATDSKVKVVRLFSYKVAAACVALAVCCFSLFYLMNREELVPLKLAELEKVVPNHNRATITLSNGSIVELEGLKKNTAVRNGNTIIRKDEYGQLSYTILDHTALQDGKKTGRADLSANVKNSLQTAKASQYTITLSDGTRVYLNALSRLSYPEQFGQGDRIVELSGEAYFEVTKTLQKSRFIVKTKSQTVEVLGTKFNINAYGDQPFIRTTLAEGSVRVTPVNKAIAAILLKPDQQSVLAQTALELNEVDAAQFIAWKNGYFIFDGNNTDEIMREIAKWYGIEIQYQHTSHSVEYAGKLPKNIGLARLMELLNYAGIRVQAFKDKNNQTKLIIN